jgi:hypothetical protein
MTTLDSLRSSSPALTGGAVAPLSRGDAATSDRSAGWFNEALAEGSRVLRAPAAPTGESAQALTERFLDCVCQR